MTGASSLLLGIDMGTTATKIVLLDPVTGETTESTQAATLHSRLPGHAEADLEQWCANIGRGVTQSLAMAGAEASAIAAVATTGMVPALAILDADGQPLRRVILQNDARAVDEIHHIATELDDLDLVALTGSALTQQSIAPTLRWLLSHETASVTRAATVTGSYDAIAMRLGAERHVESNWAVESGLFTLDEVLLDRAVEAARIDASVVPPVRRTAERIGVVGTAGATWSGIPVGTPLVVGGADHVLAAWACGLAEPGDWLLKLGGAGDILVVADHPTPDPRYYLDRHPDPALWLPNGCMATSGSLVKWFAALVGTADLAALDAEASAARPGSILCMPYLLGEKSPLHDPDLRGAFLGLGLDTGRGAMFRSVLEAVAFGFRLHRDGFVESGHALSAIPRVSDGGSHSHLWLQILADVLSTPVTPVRGTGGAGLGAAIAAGIGIGVIDGWSGARAYTSVGETVYPDPSAVRTYDDVYSDWLAASEAVTPISHRIAERTRS